MVAKAGVTKPNVKSGGFICKRSFEDFQVFDDHLPPLSSSTMKLLPQSMSDIQGSIDLNIFAFKR